ncbi:MAG TPA: hypothetical protein VFF98_17060 [Novosphingobium sp.]|nr:hypothetical protein [Novosphingobium sp.]
MRQAEQPGWNRRVPLAALGSALLAWGTAAQAAPGADHLMLMFNAPAGDLAAYQNWYDHIHAPAILAVPGFVDAQRAEAAPPGPLPDMAPPSPFLIRYRLRSADLAATFAAVPKPDPAHPAPIAPGGFALVFDALGTERRGAGALVLPHLGPPATFDLYVLESPREGEESAFNQWYDQAQLARMLATPGIVSARRYVRSPIQRDRTRPSPRYLAAYRIVSNRIDLVLAGLARQGALQPSGETVDAGASMRFLYRLCGPLINHSGQLPAPARADSGRKE